MHLSKIVNVRILTVALFASASWVSALCAQSTGAKKPDNTAMNKGDQKPGAVTADQQKTNATDRDLTAKIRRSVMADKSLSTYGHNVKIITQNGIVTLRGPVRSNGEVESIGAKAIDIAGGDNVVNQLTVQPSSKR